MKTVLEDTLGHIQLIAILSEDQLGLYLTTKTIDTAPRMKISRSSLETALEPIIDSNRLRGQMIESIVAALNRGEDVCDKRIAHGDAPIPGKNGYIEYLSELATTIDRNTSFAREILNLTSGCFVATVTPPTAGEPGTDVFGDPIPSTPGVPATVLHDQSFLLIDSSKEGGKQCLQSRADGFPYLANGQITLQEDLFINGDIDITTGSIDYMGAIQVSGDVSKGYNLTANRGIQIAGRTHGGSLHSASGSVHVEGFVSGQPGDTVVCGRSFEAKMLQQMDVRCEGRILIASDVMDSSLYTYGVVSMPEGHFLGKSVQSLYGIEARNIGSGGGSRPIIDGFSKDEIQKILVETEEEYLKVTESLEHYTKTVQPMLRDGARIPPLKNAQLLGINRLFLKIDLLRCKNEVLQRRRTALEQALQQHIFQINYHDTLYKGCTVTVGEEEFIAPEDLKGPGSLIFNSETGKFTVSKLRPIKTPEQPEQS